MVKDKSKTKQRQRHQYIDIQAYNDWCREFKVSSQYYEPTHYYHTDYHYEIKDSGWLHNLIRRLTDVI